MKKLVNYALLLVLVSMCLSNNLAFATSGEFDKDQRIDSNEWTKMASETKSTDRNYAAIIVNKMWKVDGNRRGSEAENYKKIYARMSSNKKTIIQKIANGDGSYSDGRITLNKGEKMTFLLKEKYREKGVLVNIFLEGHDPSLDCYASGSWNIDRANGDL